jgi:hypothetical protein
MAKRRYEYCEVAEIRGRVEEQLRRLRDRKGVDETPADFWARAERVGLLLEALALYDQIAAGRKQSRRETKKQFGQRIEREGRHAELERARAELLASGLTNRETQAELVNRFQPRDGTKTRAWETPDPWRQGRLCRGSRTASCRWRDVVKPASAGGKDAGVTADTSGEPGDGPATVNAMPAEIERRLGCTTSRPHRNFGCTTEDAEATRLPRGP